jgi:hypothetical protein
MCCSNCLIECNGRYSANLTAEHEALEREPGVDVVPGNSRLACPLDRWTAPV